MAKKLIEVVKWATVCKQVSNSGFVECVDQVSELLGDQQKDYVYVMNFEYGEKVIEDGQMRALIKTNSTTYKNKFDYEFSIKYDCSFSKETDQWEQFSKDCERNTDHPLSYVQEGCIEIYSTNCSGDTEIGNYEFPLNILQTGDLFGVWGSLNIITENFKKKQENWFGVAGRRCIIPTFPTYTTRNIDSKYADVAEELFEKRKASEVVEKTIREIKPAWRTQIIVFPEHFFCLNKNDSSVLQDKKRLFQLHLFKKGWQQSKKVRDVLWETRDIEYEFRKHGKESDKQNHNYYNYQYFSHLVDVIEGDDYLLKLVDKNDGLLWECYQNLDRGNSKLINYTHPYLFIYSKFDNCSWGIVSVHSPALNVPIPTGGDLRSGSYSSILSHKFQEIINGRYKNKLKFSRYHTANEFKTFVDKYLKPTIQHIGVQIGLEDAKIIKPPKLIQSHFYLIEKKSDDE
jgi:hypothetical protein